MCKEPIELNFKHLAGHQDSLAGVREFGTHNNFMCSCSDVF
jgi:hypothetical protein